MGRRERRFFQNSLKLTQESMNKSLRDYSIELESSCEYQKDILPAMGSLIELQI